MTPDDEDDGFDPTDADPERWEARAQEAAIVRQSAEIDQLKARMAETEADAAAAWRAIDELRAEVAALHARMDAADARLRRARRWYAALTALTWAVAGATLAVTLF